MINAVELSYDTAGNYSGACAAVAGMLTGITNAGGTGGCYSHNAAGDVNTRWAAAAKNADGTKAWVVDSTGVAAIDYAGVSDAVGNNVTWDGANAACTAIGDRMPSLEQMKALYTAYGTTPTGFTNFTHWTGTAVPSNTANGYYIVLAGGGPIGNIIKSDVNYLRCIKS